MTVSSKQAAVWSFGQLPESYEQKRGNYKVKAWPALVDERDSVAIKLFDNPLEQKTGNVERSSPSTAAEIFPRRSSIYMRSYQTKQAWTVL